MKSIIKFVLLLSILLYVVIRLDVTIKSERWEDGSGRVSVTYCLPDNYCD